MKIKVGWCPSNYTLPRPHFQIGGNTNLFDWTYIGNIAYAHMLATDKLIPQPPSTLDVITQALDTTLPSIDLTMGYHHVPTSSMWPLGLCIEHPEEAIAILATFEGPYNPECPVMRSLLPFSVRPEFIQIHMEWALVAQWTHTTTPRPSI
jgi:3-beta hydroxysteroid dehydrogenase/isomerase family